MKTIEHFNVPIDQLDNYIEQLKIHHHLQQEYMYIVQQSHKKTIPISIGLKNDDKNRYSDVIAYDDTRVILSDGQYINANWINDRYIATQGPLENTIADFWEMIWTYHVSTIVMLTKEYENINIKCNRYWPYLEPLNLDLFQLSLEKCERVMTDIYLNTIILHHKKTNTSKKILLYHYLAWPDYVTPSSPKTFIQLINIIDQSALPICVHCSAGIGRTGTFITIHTILNEIKKGILNINVVDTVLKLREQRGNMVQSKEQLFFCYEALYYELKRLQLIK